MPRYVRRTILKDLSGVHSAWANWYLHNRDYAKSMEAISLAMKCRVSIGVLVKYILLQISPSLVPRLVSLRDAIRKAPIFNAQRFKLRAIFGRK